MKEVGWESVVGLGGAEDAGEEDVEKDEKRERNEAEEADERERVWVSAGLGGSALGSPRLRATRGGNRREDKTRYQYDVMRKGREGPESGVHICRGLNPRFLDVTPPELTWPNIRLAHRPSTPTWRFSSPPQEERSYPSVVAVAVEKKSIVCGRLVVCRLPLGRVRFPTLRSSPSSVWLASGSTLGELLCCAETKSCLDRLVYTIGRRRMQKKTVVGWRDGRGTRVGGSPAVSLHDLSRAWAARKGHTGHARQTA